MNNNPATNILKIVGIASVGGGLEMYDFVIYAFFAPIIGKLFFPSGNNLVALLAAFAVFAIGYFMRPVGAIIFGHFGDTLGRKKTLLITIIMMAVATVLIGCLPTYQHVGIISPVLLVVLRLIQGLAMGGDLPGAITFVAEHVSSARRGLYCSWIYMGINLGFTLAAIVSTIIAAQLDPTQLNAFGWRIGFWFGLVLAGIGYYLRTFLEETPSFKRLLTANFVHRFPIKDVFKYEFPAFLQALGIVCLVAVIVGFMLFMPSYLHLVANFSLEKALLFNTCGMLIWSLLIVVMGYCADCWGRKPVMSFSAITLILFSQPLFALIATAKISLIIAGILGFAVLMSGIMGAFASTISELFTTPVRNSGVGAAYNVGFALFGSVTPLVMTALLKRLGPTAPGYWLICAAIITLIAVLTITETAKLDLRDVRN